MREAKMRKKRTRRRTMMGRNMAKKVVMREAGALVKTAKQIRRARMRNLLAN